MSHSAEKLPYFQQLQMQFAAHIRNPEIEAYAPQGEKPIEERRLKAYQDLFFNNVRDFFSQLFPVCKEILGEKRWLELIREYMVKHEAETPLFHQLGEEFLLFLQQEYQPEEGDPEFLLELAHYEWVELALAISEEENFKTDDSPVDLNSRYQLSALAWPLAYEWPVHELSASHQPQQKPESVTTLLVYRTVDQQGDELIDFMTLTPMLYQWLQALAEHDSAKKALQYVTQGVKVDEATLDNFAKQTLAELIALGIIRKAND